MRAEVEEEVLRAVEAGAGSAESRSGDTKC